MKKPYIFAIAVLMALSLCACRSGNNNATSVPTTQATSRPTTAPTTAPTVPSTNFSEATNIPDPTVDSNSTDNTMGSTGGSSETNGNGANGNSRMNRGAGLGGNGTGGLIG